jgi:hypothetical protein
VELDSTLKSVIVFQLTPTATGSLIAFIISFPAEIKDLLIIYFTYFTVELSRNQTELKSAEPVWLDLNVGLNWADEKPLKLSSVNDPVFVPHSERLKI